MKNKIKYLVFILFIITLLFPNISHSQEGFLPIKKDEKSKVDGIVLNIEAASKIMADIKICEEKIENAKLIENKINELKIDVIKNINNEEIKNIRIFYDQQIYKFNDDIKIKDKNIQILTDRNKNLSEDLIETKTKLKITKYSIFFLSALTIGEFLYIYYK